MGGRIIRPITGRLLEKIQYSTISKTAVISKKIKIQSQKDSTSNIKASSSLYRIHSRSHTRVAGISLCQDLLATSTKMPSSKFSARMPTKTNISVLILMRYVRTWNISLRMVASSSVDCAKLISAFQQGYENSTSKTADLLGSSEIV